MIDHGSYTEALQQHVEEMIVGVVIADDIRLKLRRGNSLVVAVAIIGLMAFLATATFAVIAGQPHGIPYLKVFLILSMVVVGGFALALIFAIQRIVYASFASAISDTPSIKEVDDGALSVMVRKRFTKSGFLYASGKVPSTMMRTRLSATPNEDGSYWMMTTDDTLSMLRFEKYRVGDIPEPNDPESLNSRIPPEVRANASFFGKRW